ncbi:hypothetical protein HK103_006197 [Boothiomyces macroporosus]|uniref:Uncharacterized protein n=1 Tax=Boothiomyces macroporosus TaxID=261099 RepID=A0AAD5Y287_9FUNG|nr:hypothetical protein HK103_006197 [Boothiomyces macroporosus]
MEHLQRIDSFDIPTLNPMGDLNKSTDLEPTGRNSVPLMRNISIKDTFKRKNRKGEQSIADKFRVQDFEKDSIKPPKMDSEDELFKKVDAQINESEMLNKMAMAEFGSLDSIPANSNLEQRQYDFIKTPVQLGTTVPTKPYISGEAGLLNRNYTSKAYEPEVDEANEQIAVLIKENDKLLEENDNQHDEITHLKHNLTNLGRQYKSATENLEETKDQIVQFKHDIETAHDEKKQLERKIKAGTLELATKEADLDQLHSINKKKQRELENQILKNQELQALVADLTDRYQELLKETAIANTREKELLEEIQRKNEAFEEIERMNKSLVQKNKDLEEQAETQTSIIKNLERKITLAESKEIENIDNRQREIHELEEALFERDSAIKREQSLALEVQSLTQKCLELPKTFEEKNDLEIQRLKSQFQAERKRAALEANKLEELCTNLQSQVERAIREKRAAESELEKLTRHIPAESDRLTMAIDEMHSKLRASERDRNEAVQRLESVHQKMLRDQQQYEQERHQNAERQEDTYRRLKRVEREVEENKNERITLLQKVSALEHEKKQLVDNLSSSTANYETQIKNIKSKYELQLSEQSSRLDNVSNEHAKTCRDMQRLISTQRCMSDKWKEEANNIREHYEQTISKINHQLAQSGARINELESIIQKNNAQRRDLIDQVTIEKRQFGQLHDKYLYLEKQNEETERQLGVLVAKEAEMIEERKKLCRELDKALLDKSHRKKYTLKHQPVNTNDLSPPVQMTETMKLEADIERIKQRQKQRKYKSINEIQSFVDDSD